MELEKMWRTHTMNNTTREVADLFRSMARAAVTTHTGADGDAIGSAVALVYLLRCLGLEVVLCYVEEVPTYLRWLLPEEPLRECPSDYELLVVDTSRADRIGVARERAMNRVRLNLDHHEDNPLYGEMNLVDAKAAASAQIVATLYEELRVSFHKKEEEEIYAGVSTDTGGFRVRKVTPETHELVADLLRAGVVPAEVDNLINHTSTVEQLNIVGVSLANAERYGEALISTVDNSDYERTGAT